MQIIIRARQNHLLDALRKSSTELSQALITQASEAWTTYFNKNLGARLTPSEESPDAAWQKLLEKETADEKWWNEAKAADEKFTMHIASLVS